MSKKHHPPLYIVNQPPLPPPPTRTGPKMAPPPPAPPNMAAGGRCRPSPCPALPKMAAGSHAPPLHGGPKMAGGAELQPEPGQELQRIVEALELLLQPPAGPGERDGGAVPGPERALRPETLRSNAAELEERLRRAPGWAALRGLRHAVLARAPALAAGAADEAEPGWATACGLLALLLCLKERLVALAAAAAPSAARGAGPGAAPPPSADTLSVAQGRAVGRALRAAVGLGLVPYLPPGVGQRPGTPAPPPSTPAARGVRLHAATAALAELAEHPALGGPLLTRHLGLLLAGLCLLGHGPAAHSQVCGSLHLLLCGAGVGTRPCQKRVRATSLARAPSSCSMAEPMAVLGSCLLTPLVAPMLCPLISMLEKRWEPGEGLEGHRHTVGAGGFSTDSWAALTTLGFVFSRVFRKRSERGAGRPCSKSWTASTSRWQCGSCLSCRAVPSRYPATAGPAPVRGAGGAYSPRCWDGVCPRAQDAFAAVLEVFLHLKNSLVQHPTSLNGV